MIVIIGGTPGTGKTSASEILGKKIKARVMHLREFVKEKHLSSGFDEKTKSEIVPLDKLEKELKKEIAKRETRNSKLIVEGHLACEIQLPAKFVFVLRCNPKELEKRLKKRKYRKEKMNGNLLAEMLDYCTQMSEANYEKSGIFEIETAGKTALQTAEKMRKIISGKKPGSGKISYAAELKKFLGLG